MENLPSHLLIPAGAIVAALIAGLFSFFSLILSKEQKLSELRQNWIEGLREDLGEYVYALNAISYMEGVYKYQHKDNIDYVSLMNATADPHRRAVTSFTRIVLRLNPNDKSKSHIALLAELNKSRDAFTEGNYDEATKCLPEIRAHARIVLKDEWERVKGGEPTFVWSKRGALVVLVCAVVLGGYLAYGSRSEADKSPEMELHDGGLTDSPS